MPEGHTIHRLARDLNRTFRSKRVSASSPQGRFEAGADRIDSQIVSSFQAFGKQLVGQFDSGDVLHVHLGLIGKFRKTTGEPVGAVRLRLTHDDVHWDLRGPMVCTIGTPELIDKVAASVGPDPLRKPPRQVADDRVDRFVAAMKRKRIAVGAALLDQKVIAGIGNVYRAELLFIAGINPRTPANKLSEATLRELWDLATEQLRQGEKLNRIVTVDAADAGYATARAIRAGDRLYVYKRQDQPCRRCGSLIEQREVAGRKMWECPQCQK